MINRLSEINRSDEALAKRVIGLAMKVHSTLGCGFLESIYARALALELSENGIPFETEKKYSVSYGGQEIGQFYADLVVQDCLIVETKAVDALSVAHSVQIVNYLAVAKLDLGLLLNFGPRSLEFKTKTRSHPMNSEPPNLQF